MPHVHIGVAHAIITFLMVLVVGTLWRAVAMWNADNDIGRTMAFMY